MSLVTCFSKTNFKKNEQTCNNDFPDDVLKKIQKLPNNKGCKQGYKI